MVYKIDFYAYLPKILIYFYLHFNLRSEPDLDFFTAESDPDPFEKMSGPHPCNKLRLNACMYEERHDRWIVVLYRQSN